MEELRHFVVSQFKETAKDTQRIENTILVKLGEMERAIDPLKPHLKDLGVLDRVRHLASVDEVKSAIDEKVGIVGQDLEGLKALLNSYTIRLDECVAHNVAAVEKVQVVEKLFQDHVEMNFRTVEQEYGRLQGILDGVIQGQEGKVTEAGVQMMFHQVRAETANVLNRVGHSEGQVVDLTQHSAQVDAFIAQKLFPPIMQ